MLDMRANGAELLELLDFHPPHWRRYYEDLWVRYPTLARDWVHYGFLNHPVIWRPERWEQEVRHRQRLESAKREHQDTLILAEIRGRAQAVMARRGADRVRAQRALDRRLDELGLRPIFPGGTHIHTSQRPAMKRRYTELRSLIDELRTAAADGDPDNPKYRLALLIRFPLFTEEEIDLVFRYPYPRHGATADAALAVLANRFTTRPDTLDRYLFPRSANK
jgi:hypothetical protein